MKKCMNTDRMRSRAVAPNAANLHSAKLRRASCPAVFVKFLLFILLLAGHLEFLQADDPFIPRTQTKPPGPPLSPAEALSKMEVPEGFRVELVASEPDIINPVAMTFDDRGRIWVTESFEYPRHEAGPGRDRIKILEDTDHDGKVDKVTIFAEGLNIPSGIAVGHGGVWVANAPDILFLEDTDGDDRADKQTVVVTGFGRYDTHELPNSLTWGPDGWLYGLNGVFNPCHVEQDGRVYDFTCAMFRIHPKTWRFEIFCEGTSNPWGIAFDVEGSAFISACVIDHLWHLSETGYYHRQGGPYPPNTWKMESIVNHKHQMAAYCGIEFFDSAAYPESYRSKLFMGNIHGGCVNVDRIERHGATYRGFGEPDFLTANDVWFMPVVQKVGPDGCLYILDWYDRYHCYQDASADPKGVDRGHGRLYRVVHESTPKHAPIDISKATKDQLVQHLASANIYVRQRAQLEIAERRDPSMIAPLTQSATSASLPLKTRLTNLWALGSMTDIDDLTLQRLLADADPAVQAWGVRFAGNQRVSSNAIISRVFEMAAHEDDRVRLQVAIAANKLAGERASAWLFRVAEHSREDGILPQIIWQNLKSHLQSADGPAVRQHIGNIALDSPVTQPVCVRLGEYWLGGVDRRLSTDADRSTIDSILQLVGRLQGHSADQAAHLMMALITKTRNGELDNDQMAERLAKWLVEMGSEGADRADALQLALLEARALTGDQMSAETMEKSIESNELDIARRMSMLSTLATRRPSAVRRALDRVLEDARTEKSVDSRWRDFVLGLSVDRGDKETRDALVASLPMFDLAAQATVAIKLAQREDTARAMLKEIEAGRLKKEIVSPNQVLLLAQSKSDSIRSLVTKIWGKIRVDDADARRQIVRQFTDFLMWEAKGNAERGLAVYDRVCGQCHVLHNRGFEVGPSITSNGRGSFEQLVVSVFDPSLVIGEAYKSVVVLTDSGQVIQGLLVEKTSQNVTLKVQGGKMEAIPVSEIEEIKENPKSLMPEGIEEQMSRQEMADLFALLCLENSLESGQKSVIPGTPKGLMPSNQ